MRGHIFSQILEAIREGGRRFGNTSYFNALACELFKLQIKNNPLYKLYCERVQADLNPKRWQDICFLPIHAFKSPLFNVDRSKENKLQFLSSGTSLGDIRSRHLMKTSLHYDAVIDQLLINRFKIGKGQTCFVSLIPSFVENPHSSLSYMISRVNKKKYFQHAFRGVQKGMIYFEALTQFLKKCELEKQSVFFATTTLALIDYMHWMQAHDVQIRLPKKSLIMDTGGYKGKILNTTRALILNQTIKYLGISKDQVVNEYGMTELSSQFYDQTGTDIKKVPAWCKVAVLNPKTNHITSKDGRGILRIVDLANVWFCAFIQTEDIAKIDSSGFQVLGRASGSGLRGCSIDYEELKYDKA